MRIREAILTLAGVWLFLAGSVGQYSAQAQSGRSDRSETTEKRVMTLEERTALLNLELERRTLPIVVQMQSLREDVGAIKESQTWTNRALIGAIGGLILSRLWQMMMEKRSSPEKPS